MDITNKNKAKGRSTKVYYKKCFVTYLMFIFIIGFSGINTGLCIEEVLISDTPMEAVAGAPPAILMFVLDNSGSMDWEFMIKNNSGLFEDAVGTRYNIYEPGDYENGSDSVYWGNLSGSDRRYWRSRWAELNKVFYEPSIIYIPWPTITLTPMGDADTLKPISNPYNFAATDSKLVLGNTYINMSGVDVKVAHYFVRHPATGNVFLVNFTNGVRSYYRHTGGIGDLYINDGQLSPVALTALPDSVQALSDAEDLQNFANWVSYYRKRELTAKAAVAITIRRIEGIRVGLYTINATGGVRQTPLNVEVVDPNFPDDDYSDDLLHLLYDVDSNNGTPLRVAVENVGEFFEVGGSNGNVGPSPFTVFPDGAECLLTFALVMTDGYWNGGAPSVGNSDGVSGAPYQDSQGDTLADVAMEYYKRDLAPLVDDMVPTSACDDAQWQHMITYGVSFGVEGHFDPADYPPCDYQNAAGTTPPWNVFDNLSRVDDLYHAAVNGRGEYLNASDPIELVNSLNEIINSIYARMGTAASVTVNSQKLITGTMYFQPIFNSGTWAGNLKAKAINPDGTIVLNPVWNADTYFTRNHANYIPYDHVNNRIVTYNPTNLFGSRGVEFQYNNLTNDQLIALYPDSGVPADDADMRSDLVDFIRGDRIQGFREREITLGDIVHSAPVKYNNTIFVGANDGKLHAFNALTGEPRFAYIPNLVMGNYYNAADPNNSFYEKRYSHKFFVDQSPYIRQNVDSTTTLLIGGLGKGGKGVYCLNVKNADNVTSVSDAESMVLWEFPAGADDDIGFTYSRPVIAKSNADIDGNATNQDWIAIFGNGYNSVNGHAVLYILNAKTGALVKKISTFTGAGLSSSAVTDINRDLKADYVYAGDLDGNMWKFDLTGSTVASWGVAYNDGTDEKPLVNVGKPITTRPDVMLHCEYGGGSLMCGSGVQQHKPLRGYMVIFGTGLFLHADDVNNIGDQYMFGIWDYGDDIDNSEYLGDWDSVNNRLSNLDSDIQLLEQEVAGWINTPIGLLPFLTQNTTDWSNNIDCDPDSVDQNPDPDPNYVFNPDPATIPRVGWFRQLFTDHMIFTDPRILGGRALYIESSPNSDMCHSGGDSVLWEVNGCTGGRLPYPVFDTNGDGVIDHNDVDGPGLPFDKIVYPPAIIAAPDDGTGKDDEFKILSTSAGVEIILEKGATRGFTYWRVIQ